MPATIAAMAVLATLAITAAPREAHADPGATFTVNPIDLVNGYFNFEIGYTLILAEVFVASVGIGAGHRNFTTDVDGERIGHRGLEPRFRLALGFAF